MLKRLCLRCGHVGSAKGVIPGSFAVEVLLWILFAVPSIFTSWLLLIVPLIYSLWRWSARHHVCAECGSKELVPLTSPVAREKIAASPALQQAETAARGFRPSLRTIAALAFLGFFALMVLGGMVLDKVGTFIAQH